MRLRGRAAGVQIKASNLRRLVDSGRAAVAGHEIDALQSVVLGGATGVNAICNGVYNLNPAHTANEFPVFTHTTVANRHLFCGDSGLWFVGPTEDMTCNAEIVLSQSAAKFPAIFVSLAAHHSLRVVISNSDIKVRSTGRAKRRRMMSRARAGCCGAGRWRRR